MAAETKSNDAAPVPLSKRPDSVKAPSMFRMNKRTLGLNPNTTLNQPVQDQKDEERLELTDMAPPKPAPKFNFQRKTHRASMGTQLAMLHETMFERPSGNTVDDPQMGKHLGLQLQRLYANKRQQVADDDPLKLAGRKSFAEMSLSELANAVRYCVAQQCEPEKWLLKCAAEVIPSFEEMNAIDAPLFERLLGAFSNGHAISSTVAREMFDALDHLQERKVKWSDILAYFSPGQPNTKLSFPCSNVVTTVSLSRDGSGLAMGGIGFAALVNMDTCEVIATLSYPQGVNSVKLSSDASHMYVGAYRDKGRADSEVDQYVINHPRVSQHLEPTCKYSFPSDVLCTALSDDDQVLVIGGKSKSVLLYNVHCNSPVMTIPCPTSVLAVGIARPTTLFFQLNDPLPGLGRFSLDLSFLHSMSWDDKVASFAQLFPADNLAPFFAGRTRVANDFSTLHQRRCNVLFLGNVSAPYDPKIARLPVRDSGGSVRLLDLTKHSVCARSSWPKASNTAYALPVGTRVIVSLGATVDHFEQRYVLGVGGDEGTVLVCEFKVSNKSDSNTSAQTSAQSLRHAAPTPANKVVPVSDHDGLSVAAAHARDEIQAAVQLLAAQSVIDKPMRMDTEVAQLIASRFPSKGGGKTAGTYVSVSGSGGGSFKLANRKSVTIATTPPRLATTASLGSSNTVEQFLNGAEDVEDSPVPTLIQQSPVRVSEFQYGSAVNAISLSMDGEYFAVAGKKGELVVMDTQCTDARQRMQFPHMLACLALSVDGHKVAVGGDNGSACLLDVDSGCVIKYLQSEDTVRAVALSRDCTKLVMGGFNKQVLFCDVTQGAGLHAFGVDDIVRGVALDASGNRVAIVGDDGNCYVYDTSTGECLRCWHHRAVVWAVAISKDGSIVVSGDHNGNVIVRHVDDFVTLFQHQFDSSGGLPFIWSVALNADASLVAASCWNGEVRVWRRGDWKQACATIRRPDRVFAIDLTPDGRLLGVGDRRGVASVFRLHPDAGPDDEPELVFEVTCPNRVYGAALSADGMYFAVTGLFKQVLMYHIPSKLKTVFQSTALLQSVCFSVDGVELLACGEDKKISVWNVASGELKLVLPRDRNIHCVTACPNRIAFACGSKAVLYGGVKGSFSWKDRPDFEVTSEIMQHPECFKTLLKWFPAVHNSVDAHTGESLLQRVARMHQNDMLRLVLATDAHVGLIKDNAGSSAMIAALNAGNMEAVDALITAVATGRMGFLASAMAHVASCFAHFAAKSPTRLLNLVAGMPLVLDTGSGVSGRAEASMVTHGLNLFRGSTLPVCKDLWRDILHDAAHSPPIRHLQDSKRSDSLAFLTEGGSGDLSRSLVKVTSYHIPFPHFLGKSTAPQAPSACGMITLAALEHDNYDHVFASPIMEAAMDWKWMTFGRRVLYIRLFLYLAQLAILFTFVWAVTLRDQDTVGAWTFLSFQHDNKVATVTWYMSIVPFLIRLMRRKLLAPTPGLLRLSPYWCMTGLVTYGCLVAWVFCRRHERSRAALMALVSCAAILRGLAFVRFSLKTQTVLDSMCATLVELVPWFILAGTIGVAFMVGLFVLIDDNESDTEWADYDAGSIAAIFLVLFFERPDRLSGVQHLALVVNLFVALVLANFLVAATIDALNKNTDSRLARAKRQRAELLCHIEKTTLPTLFWLQRTIKLPWLAPGHASPQALCPKWLHVLKTHEMVPLGPHARRPPASALERRLEVLEGQLEAIVAKLDGLRGGGGGSPLAAPSKAKASAGVLPVHINAGSPSAN